MQYLEEDMCLLFLRDFTVADFSGDKQQYRSLRCHETLFSRGEFITLSLPQSMISDCATPVSPDFSPAPLYFKLLTSCSVTPQTL